MEKGIITKVSGPLVVADKMSTSKMFDVVKVSDEGLIGEIIELHGDKAFIQVYEETGGIGPGDPVYPTSMPLSVELGPGLTTSIYDGIQRPLSVIKDAVGDYITRGVEAMALDREKVWDFVATAKEGDEVEPGDILGEVRETVAVVQKILVPPNVSGKIKMIKSGQYKVEDVVCEVKTEEGNESITMMQKWPVRVPRPYKRKIKPDKLLTTGQRVVDAFFPLAKGGTACVPGPFGSGKTVIQHQLAKWADAEVIVYIGCGERGNEMTDVLQEFPHLKDPKTGEALINRTVLVANTSNMPVAAREASVYTGITIAEYFRDMGYSVAVMADSTSRWAEAMREISGRLEEMPGEEGYPAYLGTRIAEFYERSGRVITLGSGNREGSLSTIGAVSPPGGDLSDPVVQATLRVVKVFWSLEDKLAYQRHFPAISWLNSYSLYHENIEQNLREEVAEDIVEVRQEAMKILQEEAELAEIVKLVGVDSLSDNDRLTLETARSLREDFLHQNAFHEVDSYCSSSKMTNIMKLILFLHHNSKEALEKGISFDGIANMKVKEEIARAKYVPEGKAGEIEKIKNAITSELELISQTYAKDEIYM
ncbi:MAG: V-type ATP synthase subunit A [Deltaproteobacteria bacterium]|uniref:V-type ATP synthase alpha chain n=1 Tax=Candidatus Zymogenus saltonus TaxID=2844893 RepID=A0A9D8KC33_9DELT|nr:V-type ATP synthase subunit A [Candidatus Zymogenus saltonus]